MSSRTKSKKVEIPSSSHHSSHHVSSHDGMLDDKRLLLIAGLAVIAAAAVVYFMINNDKRRRTGQSSTLALVLTAVAGVIAAWGAVKCNTTEQASWLLAAGVVLAAVMVCIAILNRWHSGYRNRNAALTFAIIGLVLAALVGVWVGWKGWSAYDTIWFVPLVAVAVWVLYEVYKDKKKKRD